MASRIDVSLKEIKKKPKENCSCPAIGSYLFHLIFSSTHFLTVNAFIYKTTKDLSLTRTIREIILLRYLKQDGVFWKPAEQAAPIGSTKSENKRPPSELLINELVRVDLKKNVLNVIEGTVVSH